MEEPKKEISFARTLLLPKYFSFIRIFSLLSIFAIWLIASMVPIEYFSIFHSARMLLWVMFGFFIFFLFAFSLQFKIRHPFIDYILGASWPLFYLYVIWQSGGVTSPFIILLIFSIFVAIPDLSPKLVIYYGSLNVIGYASLFLFQKEYWHSPQVIAQYILQITFLSIICIFAYWLVKEILRQKYEKQEASKKYFQLVEVDQIKSDFITAVSHQLRIPLIGAHYALELLRDAKDEKSRVFLTAQITERVQLTLTTVNEMIKSIELGSGGLRKNWTMVPLGDLLQEVNDDLQYDRERGRTEVLLHVGEDLSIFGDRNLLKVAYANVIENAIRYTPGNEVVITAVRDGERVRVMVKDSGIGISPNDQPHIFDRFFRAKNSVKLFPNESGIGLFVARQIIERHLGTVELLSSELGKGTTMEITLPSSEGQSLSEIDYLPAV